MRRGWVYTTQVTAKHCELIDHEALTLATCSAEMSGRLPGQLAKCTNNAAPGIDVGILQLFYVSVLRFGFFVCRLRRAAGRAARVVLVCLPPDFHRGADLSRGHRENVRFAGD